MDSVIQLQDVNFSYGQNKVLEDINVDIRAEEFFGIIGPNAAGKTTLLKILLGLLQPQSGTIEVLGLSPQKAGHLIGYVPQYPAFPRNFPINVLDVVLMGRLQGGFTPGRYSKADLVAARDALKVVDISTLETQSIKEISGGQLQRVLIARALAGEPEILILDEPTANIDVQAEESIFSTLKDYNNRMTILVVSHDIAFISSYVNRVGCLNKTMLCHETESISGKTIEELYGAPVKMIHHAH